MQGFGTFARFSTISLVLLSLGVLGYFSDLSYNSNEFMSKSSVKIVKKLDDGSDRIVASMGNHKLKYQNILTIALACEHQQIFKKYDWFVYGGEVTDNNDSRNHYLIDNYITTKLLKCDKNQEFSDLIKINNDPAPYNISYINDNLFVFFRFVENKKGNIIEEYIEVEMLDKTNPYDQTDHAEETTVDDSQSKDSPPICLILKTKIPRGPQKKEYKEAKIEQGETSIILNNKKIVQIMNLQITYIKNKKINNVEDVYYLNAYVNNTGYFTTENGSGFISSGKSEKEYKIIFSTGIFMGAVFHFSRDDLSYDNYPDLKADDERIESTIADETTNNNPQLSIEKQNYATDKRNKMARLNEEDEDEEGEGEESEVEEGEVEEGEVEEGEVEEGEEDIAINKNNNIVDPISREQLNRFAIQSGSLFSKTPTTN